MKRTIAIILSAATLLSTLAFSGCSSGSSDSGSSDAADASTSGETAASSEETTSKYADAVPELNFDGADFRISSSEKYSYEMDVSEMTGDVCNDAVYTRNRLIEDRFNITIKNIVTSGAGGNEAHPQYVEKTVLAGEDVFDIAGVYTYLSGGLVLEGLYQNWYDVPYVDFTRDWWVSSANSAFSVGDKMFVAVGDLSITTLLLTYGVFFNKKITSSYDIPDLYQTVRDGKWTIDYLIEVSNGIYSDLNGDGKSNLGDLFGFSGDQATNIDVYPAAFDINLITKDADNLPALDINVEKMTTALEKVYELYYDSTGTRVAQIAGEESDSFAAGQVAFLTSWMGNAFTTLRTMDDDYGILPYPKFDEAQEKYYTNSMDNYSLLGIPKTAQNLELIGAVTEALTAESSKSVMPAYYDTALSTKYTRDEESIEMLTLIMAGRNYDFSILHGLYLENLPYLFRNLIQSKDTNFASKYASVEDKIKTELATVIATYQAQ